MTSTVNSVGMEAREAGRNAPKPLPLEALERLKADLRFLEMMAVDLDYAAMPTKPDVVTLCGSQAARTRDAIRSLLSSYEAQGERLREVEGALRNSVSTMNEQRRRFRRIGKTHAELDLSIEDAEAALTQPPAVEKTDGEPDRR